ncbi:MAG: NAD-dependent epimerase/dehydratase family protein [Opitutales bacterium]|jgi:nucleoside-diphosphate-sugar epimerase
MRVLLLGASGFIGRSIVAKTPEKIELTGTYYRNKLEFNQIKVEQFNYLDSEINWQQIVAKYDCIIVAARANAGTETTRNRVSEKAQLAFSELTQAVSKSKSKPFIVAVNGSLSYGHRGEELVKTSDNINPTGFASSYAIAEKPFRDFLRTGNAIAIIRAPWVIGSGSWFSLMYLNANRIPIINHGTQWMALVSVDDLADYVWQVVESSKSGILHPQLTYRCRQKDFAEIVQKVTSKRTQHIGRIKRMWMEKQMRESVLASIKLDDGMGDQSENQAAERRLITIVENIYSGFS